MARAHDDPSRSIETRTPGRRRTKAWVVAALLCGACAQSGPDSSTDSLEASEDAANGEETAAQPEFELELELEQEMLVVDVGAQRSLRVLAIDDAGERMPVTDEVVWRTSDEAVLSVSQDGVLLASSRGDAEVMASVGEVSVTAQVRVRGWSPLEPLYEIDAEDSTRRLDARDGHAVLVHTSAEHRALHMYAPGHGWSGAVAFPTDFAYEDPSVRMLPDRRALLLWVANDGARLWTRMFDASLGFSPAVDLGCPEGEPCSGELFVRDVAVDLRAERAVVLLSKSDGQGEPLGLFAMRWSQSDGWGAMVELDTVQTRAHRTRSCLSLDEQGRALVIYREHARFTRLHAVEGEVKGGWSVSTPIYDAPEDFSEDSLFIGVPRCSIDAAGNGVLAWNVEAIAHGWGHLHLHDVVASQPSGEPLLIDLESVLITPPTVATDDSGTSFIGRMHHDEEFVFELFRHEQGRPVELPVRERFVNRPILRATDAGSIWLFARGSDQELFEQEAQWFARRFDADTGWRPRDIFPGVHLRAPQVAASRDGTLVLSFEQEAAGAGALRFYASVHH